MLLDAIVGRFLERSPMTVAVRSTLEYALDANALDALFDQTAGSRQDRQLLFSTCVDLMTTVVCRVKPSIHAAYQADDHIGVSVSAVYRRLARVSTHAGRQLVRHTAEQLEPIIRQAGWAHPGLLPGYRVSLIYAGLKPGTSRADLERALAARTVADLLPSFTPRAGDTESR